MSFEPLVISFNSDPYFQKKPKLPVTRKQPVTNRSTSHKVCSKLHVTGKKKIFSIKQALLILSFLYVAHNQSALLCYLSIFLNYYFIATLCRPESCLPTDSNTKVALLRENFEVGAQDIKPFSGQLQREQRRNQSGFKQLTQETQPWNLHWTAPRGTPWTAQW